MKNGKTKPRLFTNPMDMAHFVNTLPKDNNKRMSETIELDDTKLSLQSSVDLLKDLLDQYNAEMVKRGYGLSKKELKAKDTINMVKVCRYEKNTAMTNISMPIISRSDINMNFINKMGWLSAIPCFQEGALRLNIGSYIYWKISQIDVDNKTLKLFLQHYMFDNGIWQIGVSGNITVRFDEHDNYDINMIDKKMFADLYKMIPYKELGWDAKKQHVWETLTIEYAERMENSLAERNTDNVTELTKLFLHFIAIANQMLDANKPKAKRETKAEKQKRIIEKGEVDTKKRKIVRTIGAISMTSNKVPKVPSKETVVRYKTAVWTCRGGVRRMKSGKLVPFKSSVKHRKCLQNYSIEKPQTEIKFKK